MLIMISSFFFDGQASSSQKGSVIDVHPGESIQEALDRAKPGDTVLVSPGIYQCKKGGEAFIIFKKRHNGITLKGAGKGTKDVILDGGNKALHAGDDGLIGAGSVGQAPGPVMDVPGPVDGHLAADSVLDQI